MSEYMCPECAWELHDEDKCPHCGYKIDIEERLLKKKAKACENAYSICKDNKKKAIKILQEYCKEDVAEAYLYLGRIYSQDKEYIDARDMYEKASEKGLAVAYNNLAYMYYYGQDVEINFEKSIELVDKAIKIDGKDPTYVKNRSFFKQALIEPLESKADIIFARYTQEPNMTVEAIMKLKNLEKEGSTRASLYLGRIYEKKENYKLAIEYYEKGCEHNISLCYNNLALIYFDGRGTERSLDKAKKLIKKARLLDDKNIPLIKANYMTIYGPSRRMMWFIIQAILFLVLVTIIVWYIK